MLLITTQMQIGQPLRETLPLKNYGKSQMKLKKSIKNFKISMDLNKKIKKIRTKKNQKDKNRDNPIKEKKHGNKK